MKCRQLARDMNSGGIRYEQHPSPGLRGRPVPPRKAGLPWTAGGVVNGEYSPRTLVPDGLFDGRPAVPLLAARRAVSIPTRRAKPTRPYRDSGVAIGFRHRWAGVFGHPSFFSEPILMLGQHANDNLAAASGSTTGPASDTASSKHQAPPFAGLAARFPAKPRISPLPHWFPGRAFRRLPRRRSARFR